MSTSFPCSRPVFARFSHRACKLGYHGWGGVLFMSFQTESWGILDFYHRKCIEALWITVMISSSFMLAKLHDLFICSLEIFVNVVVSKSNDVSWSWTQHPPVLLSLTNSLWFNKVRSFFSNHISVQGKARFGNWVHFAFVHFMKFMCFMCFASTICRCVQEHCLYTTSRLSVLILALFFRLKARLFILKHAWWPSIPRKKFRRCTCDWKSTPILFFLISDKLTFCAKFGANEG